MRLDFDRPRYIMRHGDDRCDVILMLMMNWPGYVVEIVIKGWMSRNLRAAEIPTPERMALP